MALTPFAQKWVAALRSDQYKQGTGQLRSESGFCCLGVACYLAVKEGIIAKYDGDDGTLDRYPEVMEALNLTTDIGDYGVSDDALAQDNDLGATFATIADIIESEPTGLFTTGGN